MSISLILFILKFVRVGSFDSVVVYLFGSKEKPSPKLLVTAMLSQIVTYSQAVLKGIDLIPPMVSSKFIGRDKILTCWDKFIMTGRSKISKMASIPKKARFCFFIGDLPAEQKFRGLSLKQFCMSAVSRCEIKQCLPLSESHNSNSVVAPVSPSSEISGPSWLTTDLINIHDVRAKNCLQHKFRKFHLIKFIYASKNLTVSTREPSMSFQQAFIWRMQYLQFHHVHRCINEKW